MLPGANSYLASLIPSIAHITGFKENLEVAELAAKTVLELPASIGKQAARAGLALMAVIKDDAESAIDYYATLEVDPSTLTSLFTSPISVGGHLMGLMSHTTGDRDRASALFEDALTFCRNAGYKPEQAWTCCD